MTGVPVDPAPDVGSPALAAALVSRDPVEIAAALHDAWVLVPILRRDDGMEIRLFARSGSSPERGAWELMLFSSAATLHAFLAEDPDRAFDVVRASSLADFLRAHRDTIARVVFDAAEAHAASATPDEVLATLIAAQESLPEAPRPSGRGIRPDDRVRDLDLPLGDDWFRIDLTDERSRDDAARALVERQLAGFDIGPTLRTQLHQWLRRMTSAAAGGGGRETAFLVRRSADAALALSMTRYWQRMTPGDGDSPLARVAATLRGEAGDDAEIVRASTPTGPLVRHARTGSGAAELKADGIPVLTVDYWLEFPDARGVCLVSFTTPHVELRDAVLALTDEIVAESAWVIAGPAEPGA